MRVADFDYPLPEGLIAQAPAERRDASRLLVLRETGAPEHRRFSDLPELLAAGDLLVVNDARVLPARLRGTKEGSGGKAELLLVEEIASGPAESRWLALGQAAKALRPGQRIALGEFSATIAAARGEGLYEVAVPLGREALLAALERVGEMPLPPYIARPPNEADKERYQTVYARAPVAAAAPTAGLHFTPELLDALAARGIRRAAVTLHVGPGTFLPVRAENVEDHKMHAERYEVPSETAAAVSDAEARGSRIVAVGTTALRTLEAAADKDGIVQPGAGATDLFVYPGYQFRVVDALLTNFHLPRSTLLMLVCAFAGTERVLAAYRQAVERRYRFFSYGDAMLLL